MKTKNLDPARLAKLPTEYLQANIGNQLVIVAAVFIALQIIFCILFYTSRRLTKTLNGVECWVYMPMSFIFNIAICLCALFTVKWGGSGRHVEAIFLEDPHRLIVRNQVDKAVEFIYLQAIAGSKLAILCLYLRIFTARPYRIATYFIGALIVLTTVVGHIVSLTICKPMSHQWNPSQKSGYCGNIILAYQIFCVPNIAIGVMMLILPLPAVLKLRIGTAARVGLMITFLTGSVGIVTSILRLNTFLHAAKLFEDPTYNCIETLTFVVTETNTYFIADCMPSLRPLKRHLLPNFSFTNMVERTLTVFSTGNTKSQSTGSFRKGGVMRTTEFELQSHEVSDRTDPRSLSTTRLHDDGQLVMADHASHVSSKTSNDLQLA